MDSSSNAEVPVFVDTNLGTHIAMAVSADSTAGEFKRKLENVHLNCLPELGEIMVDDVMVKQKSCLYHLPESLPLKQAFQGSKRAWSVYMKVQLWSQSDQPAISKCMAAEVVDRITNCSNVADGTELEKCASTKKNNTKCGRKKRRMKRFHCLKAVLQAALEGVHTSKKKKKNRIKKKHFRHYTVNELEKVHCNRNQDVVDEERFGLFACRVEDECRQNWNFSPAVSTPSETLSESAAVSGIIRKYFPIDDDVTSGSEVTFMANQSPHEEQLKARTNNNYLTAHVNMTPQFVAKTPLEVLHCPLSKGCSENSKGKLRNTDVGKRLLVASNNLGISASCKKPVISLCRLQDGNSLLPKSSSLVRALVFELSDDDDDDDD